MYSMKKYLLFAFIGLASFSSFSQTKYSKKDLIWSDEFNYKGLPDTTKWNFDTHGNAYGWGNNESQFYTNKEINNAVVKDGYLHIIAKKENHENKNYTSARLTTSNKFNFTYGRVDVRAKLPAGKGTWPAIWMLGEKIQNTKWPDCGEIDIMEHVGYDPGKMHGTVHTKAYNHVIGTQRGKAIDLPNPFSGFHVYSIEWTKDKIDFLLDNKVYHSFANEHKTEAEWPFDSPEYIILNLAIGGNWGGKMGIDDAIFPVSMLVDYVRVYQKK